jgi:hypothetical protein
MAAFSSFHFFAPGALSQHASVASTRPVTRRAAVDFAELAVHVGRVMGEFLLFLWTMTVLAFSALVMAGFLL